MTAIEGGNRGKETLNEGNGESTVERDDNQGLAWSVRGERRTERKEKDRDE